MGRRVVGPIVEAVVDALGGTGSSVVADYLDDDSLLHMPGGSGFAGDYQGRDAICSLLERMNTASGGTLRFETVCTTAQAGGGVRLRGRLQGRRLGRSLLMTASVDATVAGEAIREAWLACSDQSAWDRFWA